MGIEARNKRALEAGQSEWDNALPPEDDGREEFIDEQAALLLEAEDARDVQFFEFAEKADEALAEADDREFAIVQIVLAVRAGKLELAQSLAKRFEDALTSCAENLIEKSLESLQ